MAEGESEDPLLHLSFPFHSCLCHPLRKGMDVLARCQRLPL